MGASRRAYRAVVIAVVLCAGARAGASVQVDPVARLSLEGGYDSNILYNGQGGDSMGRLSPELGLHLRDHTWKLNLDAGGDLLMYPQRNDTVWNQRGRVLWHARATERLTFDADVAGTYAFDPIGLARLGIFDASGRAALVTTAKTRAEWRASHDWKVAGLFEEYLVRFDNATGAASHTPGVEAMRQIGPRLEVGGVYKFDFFQGIGAGAQNATAHEAAGMLRYRAGRRLTVEASAGPAVWMGMGGGMTVLPEAMVQVLSAWRGGGARASFRHGVGLGLLATPGLFDALEGGIMTRVGRSFQITAGGGLWRSGDIPWGSNAVLGYGIDTSFDYRIQREMLIGIGASRYARLDISAPQYDRYILGLHVTWELSHSRGEP